MSGSVTGLNRTLLKLLVKETEHAKFPERRNYLKEVLAVERERCALVARIWAEEFTGLKEAAFADHLAWLIRNYPNNPNMVDELDRRKPHS